MYKRRREKVRERMGCAGIGQLLVVNPMSVYYLTGEMVQPYERFWGLYMNAAGGETLIANRLFCLKENGEVEILWYRDGESASGIILGLLERGKTLGIDRELSAAYLLPVLQGGFSGKKLPEKGGCGECESGRRLPEQFSMAQFPMEMVKIGDACVMDVRAVKEAEEIENMRRSAAITDACAERIPKLLKEGMSEMALSNEIVRIYEESGADAGSYGTPLVAFGANAGDPHHHPGPTALRRDDVVLVDIGCRKNGYCSDLTRTFFFGEASEKMKEIYRIVLKANRTVEQELRAGMRFCDLDHRARQLIEEAGYGEYFTHRLGHSIGLEGHECSDVSAANEERIIPGMTFSIEPGIYLKGIGGVRIEDVVLVTEEGAEVLNRADKELRT